MKPRVELLYDRDCPNADGARAVLREAFRKLEAVPEWAEAPARERGYGSPTVLVNRRDVAGARPGSAPSCRVYVDAEGRFSGVPSLEQIIEALSTPGAGGS
jgi:hypothetical protein